MSCVPIALHVRVKHPTVLVQRLHRSPAAALGPKPRWPFLPPSLASTAMHGALPAERATRTGHTTDRPWRIALLRTLARMMESGSCHFTSFSPLVFPFPVFPNDARGGGICWDRPCGHRGPGLAREDAGESGVEIPESSGSRNRFQLALRQVPSSLLDNDTTRAAAAVSGYLDSVRPPSPSTRAAPTRPAAERPAPV